MLTTTRDYLRARGLVSLSDLALHLGVPTDVARAVVEKWIAKGRVERLSTPSACGSCDRCGTGVRELYRWRSDQAETPVSAARPCGCD